MPEIGELASLVNAGVFNPAVDVEWFPNTRYYIFSTYWSATTDARSTAWLVYLRDGVVNYLSKSGSYYVRAVRAGQAWSFDNLIINGDGTVTDPDTGLMWQEDTAPGTYTWQEALEYAENLTLADYSDWRLPNRHELQSLINYSRSGPAVKSALIGKTVSSGYWSATTCADNANSAWPVYFDHGIVHGYYKSGSFSVRVVRAGHTVSSDESKATRIFNKAEQQFPEWFHPTGLPVLRYDGFQYPMYYRYYLPRHITLLTYNGVVYYLYNGRYSSWGTVDEWLRR